MKTTLSYRLANDIYHAHIGIQMDVEKASIDTHGFFFLKEFERGEYRASFRDLICRALIARGCKSIEYDLSWARFWIGYGDDIQVWMIYRNGSRSVRTTNRTIFTFVRSVTLPSAL